MKLFACKECWDFKEAHPEEFARFGCGPGGLGGILVPDTVYFLSIRDACRIHDWYYRFYPSCEEKDRKSADIIFLNNMLRIVVEKTENNLLRLLRKRRCLTYYKAVRLLGGPAYHDDRNESEEFREV